MSSKRRRRPKLTSDQSRRIRWARDGYTQNPACYLCHQRPATEDDHVPMKGLFATTRGADAYWLPACRPCNGLLNEDEKYLRDVLASSGLNGEAARAAEVTWSSLQGSSPLYPRSNVLDLYRNMRDRDIYSPGGIWLGRERSFNIDSSRMDPVIQKIVKGLYYHDLRKPLPDDVTFQVGTAVPQNPKAYRAVGALFDELIQSSRIVEGEFPGVLDYWAWPISEDSSSSFWFLDFYQSIVFTVFVEGPRLQAAREVRDDARVLRANRAYREDGETDRDHRLRQLIQDREGNVIAPDLVDTDS